MQLNTLKLSLSVFTFTLSIFLCCQHANASDFTTNEVGALVFPAIGDGETEACAGDQSFQNALLESDYVIVPKGTYKCSNTIILESGKALHLMPHAVILRPNEASKDPVVWVKGSFASLTGTNLTSEIRTNRRSPTGVIKVGHESIIDASTFTSNRTIISTLRISGQDDYGNCVDEENDPLPCQGWEAHDIGIYIPNRQESDEETSYFHNIKDVMIEQVNTGIKLHGYANANIISRVHFNKIGNIGIHINGAVDNIISSTFLHKSHNATVLVLENLQIDVPNNEPLKYHVVYNQIHMGGEPGGNTTSLEIRGGVDGMSGNQIQLMGNTPLGPQGITDEFKDKNRLMYGNRVYGQNLIE